MPGYQNLGNYIKWISTYRISKIIDMNCVHTWCRLINIFCLGDKSSHPMNFSYKFIHTIFNTIYQCNSNNKFITIYVYVRWKLSGKVHNMDWSFQIWHSLLFRSGKNATTKCSNVKLQWLHPNGIWLNSSQ